MDLISLLPHELIHMIYGLLSLTAAVMFAATSSYIRQIMPSETTRITHLLSMYKDVHKDINNVEYLSDKCLCGSYSIRLMHPRRLPSTIHAYIYYTANSKLSIYNYVGSELHFTSIYAGHNREISVQTHVSGFRCMCEVSNYIIGTILRERINCERCGAMNG